MTEEELVPVALSLQYNSREAFVSLFALSFVVAVVLSHDCPTTPSSALLAEGSIADLRVSQERVL